MDNDKPVVHSTRTTQAWLDYARQVVAVELSGTGEVFLGGEGGV